MQKYSLFPSQEAYLERLGSRPYLFCGMGSGKTVMAMTRLSRAGYRKVLVITKATVRDTKVFELDRDKFGLEFDTLEVQSHAWLQKMTPQKALEYSDFALIIDEAQCIANSQSKQGQGAFILCKAVKEYLLLSGTPMSNWAGATNYAKITNFVKHKTEFYKRFVIQEKSYAHKGMDIVGYRNTDELVAWWSSIAHRGYVTDFVELPKKSVIKVDIPIKRKAYVDMIKTRMRDDEPLDSAPKLTWALRQAAEEAPEKLQWVLEKVEDAENAIVFVNTLSALHKLSEKFTKAKIKHGVWYSGKKDKFEDKDVMIVQYQSGGTGLNLQKFNLTIFLSPTYSYIDYVQAEARTHRTGQEKPCTFYQLRASNTIDEAIYETLKQKKDFDTKLINEYVEGL